MTGVSLYNCHVRLAVLLQPILLLLVCLSKRHIALLIYIERRRGQEQRG